MAPEGDVELECMLNALTTNLTSFLREAHHFDHLKNVALGECMDQQRAGDCRLRLWSSACSTGEEPYSIAMTLLDSEINLSRVDVRILATDLNTDVLEQASLGALRRICIWRSAQSLAGDTFSLGADGSGQAKASIRDLIRFRQLNLLGQLADERSVRCRFLSECFDLLRYGNETSAGGPVCRHSQAWGAGFI